MCWPPIIEQEYTGKMVIVTDHSKTTSLLCIAVLVGTSSVKKISDKEYSNLFTVRILDGSTPPTVTVRSYGAKPKLTAAAKAESMHLEHIQ